MDGKIKFSVESEINIGENDNVTIISKEKWEKLDQEDKIKLVKGFQNKETKEVNKYGR